MDAIETHYAALQRGLPSAQRACLPQMAGIAERAAMATRMLPEADLATVRNKAICDALAKVHEIENPAGFKAMLALIAWRKAINQFDYIHAQMRDPGKETAIEANEEYEREDRDYLRDKSPDPSQMAEFNEMTNMLQQGLAALDERTRRLLVGVICRKSTHKEMAREPVENEHCIGGFLDAALIKLTKILKQQGHWEQLKEYVYAKR